MNADPLGSLQPALAALWDQFRPYFKREPIALAADVPVRTLREFLSQFVWDDGRVDDHLQRLGALLSSPYPVA